MKKQNLISLVKLIRIKDVDVNQKTKDMLKDKHIIIKSKQYRNLIVFSDEHNQIFREFGKFTSQIFENHLTEGLKSFANHISKLQIPKTENQLVKNLLYFSDTIGKLKLPEFKISNDLLEKIIEIEVEYKGEKLESKVKLVEKWAEYGWVLYPDLSVTEIFNPPNSRIEADDFIMSVLNEDFTLERLNKIKSNQFIRSRAIDDIKLLFLNESYNSCILLVITSIERILLNFMKVDMNFKGTKGRISSKKYEKTTLAKLDDYENLYITYLNAKNIERLIINTFKNDSGMDWENEPDYVLRDYLSHGMSNKDWTKTDALKLILLLIKFSDYVEMRFRNLTYNNSKS